MNDTRRELARSLDAEQALLPFVPALLQDLWSLGFSPEPAMELLARHPWPANPRVLDLGCGKGALLIQVAKRFGWSGRGIDIVAEFIAEARSRAETWEVMDRVEFEVKDMADEVAAGSTWDLVVFGFDSEALGGIAQALGRIRECLTPSGHLLLDATWARAGRPQEDLPTEAEIVAAARAAGLGPIDREVLDHASIVAQSARNTESIRRRARELASRFPEHAEAFEDYVSDQEEESRILGEACCGFLLFTVET